MTKVDAIYRLYIRGYYTAEQALNIGKKKLNEEEYAELELRIYPPESVEEEPTEETEDVVEEETEAETVSEVSEETETEA